MVDKKLKIIGLVLLLCLSFNGVKAQFSPDYQQPDSIFLKTHSPLKATFMSAVLPGLGQIYNQKYWKVPIIYAGFGGMLYYAGYNNYIYKKYKDAYNIKLRIGKGETGLTDPYPNASKDNLLSQKDVWRRYRDLMYISIGFLYVAQIIDANVDANLFDFDMSEDLSLRVSPIVMPIQKNISQPYPSASLGMRCAIRF